MILVILSVRKVGFTLLHLFPLLISLCGLCTCLNDANAGAAQMSYSGIMSVVREKAVCGHDMHD